LVRKIDNSPFAPSDVDVNNIRYDEKGYPIGSRDFFLNTVKKNLEKNRVYRILRRFLPKVKYKIVNKLNN
ncbi:MAG: hypothetical protein ACTSU6_07010, partial [Candidatus Njordarchaeales archaeon]